MNAKPVRQQRVQRPSGTLSAIDQLGHRFQLVATLWKGRVPKDGHPHGLSQSQYAIVMLLLWAYLQGKTMTQAQLRAHTKLKKMTLSNALKNLSSLGFITQSPSQDTRTKDVLLSAQGHVLALKLGAKVRESDSRFFSRLSESEQEILSNLLLKLGY